MTFPGIQEAYVKGHFAGPNTYVVIKPQPLGGEKYLNSKGVWDIVDNAEVFNDPNLAVEAKKKAENKNSKNTIRRQRSR